MNSPWNHGPARVEPHVVAVGLDPVDLLGGHQMGPLTDSHCEALRKGALFDVKCLEHLDPRGSGHLLRRRDGADLGRGLVRGGVAPPLTGSVNGAPLESSAI
jgi:hypothetical protein